ncbi:MAG: hypothetical protein J3K34DRAFT_256855 [Monoraphidium minutum]|nr:MAG: hypothetical protein J3K34DRAFT_256855 [Monoraphidium minutum]
MAASPVAFHPGSGKREAALQLHTSCKRSKPQIGWRLPSSRRKDVPLSLLSQGGPRAPRPRGPACVQCLFCLRSPAYLRPEAAMMASQAALRAAMAVLLLAALLTAPAHAGCYRNGKTRPSRSKSELYWNHEPAKLLALEELPQEFSWANHNGTNWLTPSWNQHIPQYCGSCWAHGSLSMIQDRLKIAKLRAGDLTPDVMLGRQTLLNCAAFHGMGQGCDGGDTIDVFHYMAKYGLPDESCLHYMATDWSAFKEKGMKRCPADKFCVNCMPKPTKKDPDAFECWPIKKPVMYTLTRYGKLEQGDEAGMMSEILARGPLTCGIACPDDFTFKYHSSRNGGVYVDSGEDTEIDHDVEVVGWGVDPESGLKYWLVRNSWGTYWGELGFFKVQRGAGGNGALQIESGDCWYADPEHSLEDAIADGDMEGSMHGLKVG